MSVLKFCIKTKKIIFLVFILSSLKSVSQSDTVHYLPPVGATSISLAEQYVYFSTLSVSNITVTVRRANRTPITTFVINRTTPATYTLTNASSNVAANNTARTFCIKDSSLRKLNDKGLIFTSPSDFYANFRLTDANQAEMISCLGRKALGLKFRAGVVPAIVLGANRSFYTSIMATQNNTNIKISKYNSAVKFDTVGSFATTSTQDSLLVNLNAGQTYIIIGNTSSANGYAANLTGFTGALIEADKPIALNNGNLLGAVDNQNSLQDILADQPVPISDLGTEYVFIKGNGTNAFEQPLVIAAYDNTQIFIAGSAIPISTINAGQYFLINGSNFSGVTHQSIYIRTSKPGYVYQCLGGTTAASTGGLNFIPPVSCLIPKEVVIPDVNKIGSTIYTNGALVLTTAAGATVTVNGVLQTGGQAVTGTALYQTFNITGLSGLVYVVSDGPMAAGVFGGSGSVGYAGYYSGFSSLVATISSLTSTQTASSGSNATFTASISSSSIDTYQWQESTDMGATWMNLFNAGVYSGVTTPTLNLTGVTASMNGYLYHLIVTQPPLTCPTIVTSTSSTLTVLSTLPIELVSFEAACLNNTARINWSTAQEKNCKYFDLLRSEDGVNFNSIALISGNGTTYSYSHYEYIDLDARFGKMYYYKLHQIDMDNTLHTFKLIDLKPCNNNINSYFVYPNPSNTNDLQLNYVVQNNEKVAVNFYNALGQIILNESIFLEKENSNAIINIDNLANGVYFIIIESTQLDNKAIKFIKQ